MYTNDFFFHFHFHIANTNHTLFVEIHLQIQVLRKKKKSDHCCCVAVWLLSCEYEFNTSSLNYSDSSIAIVERRKENIQRDQKYTNRAQCKHLYRFLLFSKFPYFNTLHWSKLIEFIYHFKLFSDFSSWF